MWLLLLDLIQLLLLDLIQLLLDLMWLLLLDRFVLATLGCSILLLTARLTSIASLCHSALSKCHSTSLQHFAIIQWELSVNLVYARFAVSFSLDDYCSFVISFLYSTESYD